MDILSEIMLYVSDSLFNWWLLEHAKNNLEFFVPNHKGNTLYRAIEACFLDLGIGRVFFITIDDAIFNDTILTYVKKCIIG